MKLTLTTEEAQDIIKDYLADRPSICPQVIEIKDDDEPTHNKINADVLETHLRNFVGVDNKISRIKYIRQVTGLGLKEAKEMDERIVDFFK
jgi:ribosomal protein L7/L12